MEYSVTINNLHDKMYTILKLIIFTIPFVLEGSLPNLTSYPLSRL